jgi:protein SCO1/2
MQLPTRSTATTIATLLLAACLAVACGQTERQFKNIDITGADFGKDFHLTDHNGKPRSLADFRGKIVLLFFGYTHCPDVCPVTMAQFAQVMKELGADAKRVQVLFVTLDPERDTPALLAQYVPAFNPDFLGLYGDMAATKETAKAFHVFFEKQPGKTPETYSIDHTAGTYVFDTQGRLRLFVKYGQEGAPDLVADLRALLAEKS